MFGPLVMGQKPSLQQHQLLSKILEKRELKAKVLLHMSVKDLVIPHIRDITTSSGTWSALKGLYEITNSNRIFFEEKIIVDQNGNK